MAFGAKLFVILVVGICMVESTTACDTDMIEQCRDELPGYGWPALLDVPALVRENFCNDQMPTLTGCLEEFRDECTFDESENFWSYENMGQFLCSDLDRYADHYAVISNSTYQGQWQTCAYNFVQLDGTESSEEGCGACEEVLQCYLQVVEDQSNATKTYIEEFGDAALDDYYMHYGCLSGSSAVRITSAIYIVSLLSFLWST